MVKLVDIIKRIKGVDVEENGNMSHYSSFKIGGNASVVCFVNSQKSLIMLLKLLTKNDIPYYIIGNGTNILCSDQGFDGVVIKTGNQLASIKIKKSSVIAESGVSLNLLNNTCGENGFAGIEKTFGIPGSVGGAIRMNAGAYGQNVSDCLKWVKFFNGNKIVKKSVKDLDFKYRHSIFADNPSWAILECCFNFKKGNKEEIKNTMQEIIKKRMDCQPYDKPSAGSVFKRNDKFIISKCIDELGLKGYKIGDAEISTKHCGFIVNNGKATCKDVLNLIKYIQEKIYDSYGFVPQLELELMGDFNDFTWWLSHTHGL